VYFLSHINRHPEFVQFQQLNNGRIHVLSIFLHRNPFGLGFFFFFSDLSLRIIRLKGTNIKFSKHNTQWKVKEMTLLFFLRVSKALKETTLLASPKIQLAKITLSAHD